MARKGDEEEMKCSLCEAIIPAKRRQELIELGYGGFVDNFTKKSYTFCPKHTIFDISDFIKANELGKEKEMSK